jgi:hypothetical protein
MFTGHVPPGSATRRRLPLEEREAKVFLETRCVDKVGSDASGVITPTTSFTRAGEGHGRPVAAGSFPAQPGGMFWLSRKKFDGSYLRLSALRR